MPPPGEPPATPAANQGNPQMPHSPLPTPLPSRLALAALAALAAAALTLTGCGGHYRVVDNASGRIFYTRGVDRSCDGTVHFTDVRTCEEINLTSAQVEGITPEEFDRRTGR